MKETRTIQSIILKRVDHGESNIKVSVLSKHYGRMDLIARGAKRLNSKMAGHLEPITLSAIMIIRGRGADYIGNAVGEKYYPGIKNDLTKSYYAGSAIGVLGRHIKSEPTEEENSYFILLDNFLNVLDGLDGNRDEAELFYYLFLLKFMSLYGITPSLYSCIVCQNDITPGDNYFSCHQGGLVCKKCVHTHAKERQPISDDCIKILRLSLCRNLAASSTLSVDRLMKKELQTIIDSFYKYNLG
jgi:DNA repair protein RecO (recombination protein O)